MKFLLKVEAGFEENERAVYNVRVVYLRYKQQWSHGSLVRLEKASLFTLLSFLDRHMKEVHPEWMLENCSNGIM